jgi:hypothetical protein
MKILRTVLNRFGFRQTEPSRLFHLYMTEFNARPAGREGVR